MGKLKLFFALIPLFIMSSCISSTQLNERAIVEGIGIDKTADGYTVSVQYYKPDSKSTENSQTSFVKHTAKSISKAIEGINSKISKKLYFGHNNIIAIGMTAAEADIRSILEFFDSDSQTKSDICVLITEKAENVINSDNEQNTVTPLSIMEIVENSIHLGNGCDYRLFKAIAGDNSVSNCFCLPYLKITASKEIEVSGSCLFKNGKYIDTLDTEETRGLQWYDEKISDYIIEANGFDFNVVNCETSVKTLIVNNTPAFKIDVLIKIKSPSVDTTDEKLKEEATAAITGKITWDIRKAIISALTTSKCDLFDFSLMLKTNYPQYYEKNSESWHENYIADFDINVTCDFL